MLAGTGCQEQQTAPLPEAAFPSFMVGASRPVKADPCTNCADEDALIRGLVEAVNRERVEHGVSALEVDPTLMKLADFYACRLIEGGFFSHEDPFDGSTLDVRAVNFGYAFLKIGENLATGQQTPEQAVADWMRSPAHRANILDPSFTQIGVAVREGGPLGRYWVQEFGRPITAGPDETKPRARRESVADPTTASEGEAKPSSATSTPPATSRPQ